MNVYIIPILLHGLEILLPKDKHMRAINNFLESTLRAFFSLPDSVAKPTVYLLSGMIPLLGKIHLRALTMIRAIADDSGSLEWQIAERQMHMQQNKTNSWFVEVNQILHRYSLPGVLKLLHECPTKKEWGSTIKKAVNRYWFEELTSIAKYYPSLKYLAVEKYTPGKVYYMLDSIQPVTVDIRRAPTLTRIITGTFRLQSNRQQFNHLEPNKYCLLCRGGVETRDHFVRTCLALESYRKPFVDKIQFLLVQPSKVTPLEESWTELVLNPWLGIVQDLLHKDSLPELMLVTRKMLYKLEIIRSNAIQALPTRVNYGL